MLDAQPVESLEREACGFVGRRHVANVPRREAQRTHTASMIFIGLQSNGEMAQGENDTRARTANMLCTACGRRAGMSGSESLALIHTRKTAL